jgi:predicted MFS family arabinose efflux permease
LALLAILIILFKVPKPPVIEHSYNESSSLKSILKNGELGRMNITMFFHSSLMTIAFLMIPTVLVHEFAWAKVDLWQIYIPSIVLGFIFMGFAAMMGEAKEKTKLIFQIAIVLFGLSFLFMALSSNSTLFIIGTVLFFIGFMMIEPLLQSTVSKIAKIHEKGAALGVFNTFQFFGVFVGGIVGGAVLQYTSFTNAAYIFAGLSVVWFIWVWGMKNPKKSYFSYHPLQSCITEYEQRLSLLTGVSDYYINQNESLLVIKYDKLYIDEETLQNALNKPSK